MDKTQFRVLTGLLIVVIVFLGYMTIFKGGVEADSGTKGVVDTIIVRESIESPTPTPKLCQICGESIVAGHGEFLVRNKTEHGVTIYVRHHRGEPQTVIELDPGDYQAITHVQVGRMKLRAEGDGFDESTHCPILANSAHEMCWTVQGWQMCGSTMKHSGH